MELKRVFLLLVGVVLGPLWISFSDEHEVILIALRVGFYEVV